MRMGLLLSKSPQLQQLKFDISVYNAKDFKKAYVRTTFIRLCELISFSDLSDRNRTFCINFQFLGSRSVFCV